MWEKIKNYALYGDTDRENFRCIKERIETHNRNIAAVFASIASVLIGIMFLLSFVEEGFASSRPVYVLGLIFSLIQIVVSFASRKVPALTYVSVYMAVAVFLLYGTAIATLTRPEEQTVTFMVLLIFVPLIFVDRPIRMAGSLILHIVIFIVLAFRTKSGSILSVDVTDAIIFGLLAIISETIVYRAKIHGYVLEHELHIMSETDQLTGLNNRNCYEWCLAAYPYLYRQSICCIYVDVNGLHELNNIKGHKAGDEMLCYITHVVRKHFGKKDTYRVGGDEYVAFALDCPIDMVEKRIMEMKEQIAGAGYHAAIGYVFQDTRDEDINKLIVAAEAKMYQDKSDFYKVHDRRAR